MSTKLCAASSCSGRVRRRASICYEPFTTDTALAANPMALGVLAELVGPGQVLFGTDFSWAKAWMTPILTRGVERFEGFDGAARAAVWRDNALRLFPRLACTLWGIQ